MWLLWFTIFIVIIMIILFAFEINKGNDLW